MDIIFGMNAGTIYMNAATDEQVLQQIGTGLVFLTFSGVP